MNLLNISSSGLKNIVLSKFSEEDEFIMIFGQQEIKMNKIFAEFISPVISRLHYSDPTINFINFSDLYSNKSSDFNEFSKNILRPDIVSLLLDISSGITIEVNNDQAFKMRFLSIILGNEELFLKINELFPPDFSKENFKSYIEYVQTCYYFSKLSSDFDFTSLIDYIASNFYSIEEDTFLKLPRTIQYSIISNSHLQILSEDSLLDLVTRIINEDDEEFSEKVQKDDEKIESISFLEHIEFAGLSESKLREFLANFDFNRITNSLWKKLYECFFYHFIENPERIANRHSCKQTFEYDGTNNGRFKGIIKYFTEKLGGNVDEKGVCKITSSSIYKDHNPRNVANFGDYNLYFTSNIECYQDQPWLQFDFLNRKIHPTHYSLKTWILAKGNSHLKTWVIEGSNNGRDWKVLDSRNNETCLDNSYAESTFKIQTNLNDEEYFRYIRIRHNGLNSRHTNQLVINLMEFFGTII